MTVDPPVPWLSGMINTPWASGRVTPGKPKWRGHRRVFESRRCEGLVGITEEAPASPEVAASGRPCPR
jgi:hypothetical protein